MQITQKDISLNKGPFFPKKNLISAVKELFLQPEQKFLTVSHSSFSLFSLRTVGF
jgi:hypothetical protein